MSYVFRPNCGVTCTKYCKTFPKCQQVSDFNFFTPIQSYFLFDRKWPAQPLAVSCVEEGKNTAELCSQQQMIGDE